MTITGSGFPESWPNNYYNKLAVATNGMNIPLNIVTISPTQIVLSIPKGVAAKSYTFSITNPQKAIRTISFSQQTTSTPTVALTSTATIAPNVQTMINLNRTNLNTITP